MITTRWQFSLKDSLFGIVLYATFLTIAVFFPVVAIAALVATTLIFLSAVLAFISDRAPALAHAILVVFASVTCLVFIFLVVEVGLLGLTLDCWK